MDALSNHGLPVAAGLANLQAQNLSMPNVDGDHAAAGKQFEALIATMLVKEMRQSLSDGFFGTGAGADTFAGWLDKSIGDSLAENWQLDLAGMVKNSLDTKQARVDGLEAQAGLQELGTGGSL